VFFRHNLPVLLFNIVLLLKPAHFELCTMLVQGHGVAEIPSFVGRCAAQRKASRNEAHTGHAVEHSNEMHRDVHAEGPLEIFAHLPALGIVGLVVLVGKIDL